MVAREARDHRITNGTLKSTPESVAYQIQRGVNSLRDRCRGRKNWAVRVSGGLALRARPPATVRAAFSGFRAASPLLVGDAHNLTRESRPYPLPRSTTLCDRRRGPSR